MEGENNQNQSTNQAPQGNQPVGGTPTQSTGAPVAKAGDNKTLMGILAYLSILIIIPYLTSKDDPFVKFHIKQGAVLVVIELIIMVIGNMMYGLGLIFDLVNVATLVLSIIGIVNVVQGQEKELPVIGQFSKHIPI